jgi:hypothetical protein
MSKFKKGDTVRYGGNLYDRLRGKVGSVQVNRGGTYGVLFDKHIWYLDEGDLLPHYVASQSSLSGITLADLEELTGPGWADDIPPLPSEGEKCECDIKLLAAGGCQCEAGQKELEKERGESNG